MIQRPDSTEAAVTRLLHERAGAVGTAAGDALPGLGERVVARGSVIRRRRRIGATAGAALAVVLVTTTAALGLRGGSLGTREAPPVGRVSVSGLPTGFPAPSDGVSPGVPTAPSESWASGASPSASTILDPYDLLVDKLPVTPLTADLAWDSQNGEQRTVVTSGGSHELPTGQSVVWYRRVNGGWLYQTTISGEGIRPGWLYVQIGGRQVELTHDYLWGTAVSPDGTQVAYAVSPGGADAQIEVRVARLDGTQTATTTMPARTQVQGWSAAGVLLGQDAAGQQPNWQWWQPGGTPSSVLPYRQVRTVRGNPDVVLVQQASSSGQYCWRTLRPADGTLGPETACTDTQESVRPNQSGRYLVHGKIYDLTKKSPGVTLPLAGLGNPGDWLDDRHLAVIYYRDGAPRWLVTCDVVKRTCAKSALPKAATSPGTQIWLDDTAIVAGA